MASGLYDSFKVDLMDGSIDLATAGDSFKVALYNNSHAFSAGDTVYTSTNELATTGGYTQNDKALAGADVSMAANTAKWDANDTAWTSATFSAYHAVIYDVTNSNSLIASIDFSGVQTVSNGTFTIQWNASGIVTLA